MVTDIHTVGRRIGHRETFTVHPGQSDIAELIGAVVGFRPVQSGVSGRCDICRC